MPGAGITVRLLLLCLLLASCAQGADEAEDAPKGAPMLICQKEIRCEGEPRSCRAVNRCDLPR